MDTQRNKMKAGLSSLHKCPKCELNFLSKEGMEKHSARVHEGKAADFTRYKCEKCKSDFKTKQDFKQHKLPAKSMGSCTMCQKAGENTKFVNICEFTEHRNNHEKSHSNIQIKCKECNTEFKSSILFLKHQASKRLPCGRPGCSDILQGECKRNIHFRSHDKTNITSIMKPEPSDLNSATRDSSVIRSFRSEKESNSITKLGTKSVQKIQNYLEIQKLSTTDLLANKPDVDIIKLEPERNENFLNVKGVKGQEKAMSRGNDKSKQDLKESINARPSILKSDEQTKKAANTEVLDVKNENVNIEVKQKKSYYIKKGSKDTKPKVNPVDDAPEAGEAIADTAVVKVETVQVAHIYPRKAGAVVEFCYPTHTLAQLQGLGLGEHLFLPPTLGQITTAPPPSPPCPPTVPPHGYDGEEMLLGA